MRDVAENGLENALVELTAPDGRVFQFRYAGTVLYAGQDYVVLMELNKDQAGEEQLLITRLEESPEGELSFVVAQEEDVIQAVFEKYVAQSIQAAMEQEPLEDGGCGDEHCAHCRHEEA